MPGSRLLLRRLPALFLLALLALTGCRTPAPRTAPLPADSVRIEWLGHNCFLLTTGLGFAVLTDPFETKHFDYPIPSVRPDVVLVSSEEPTVSNAELAGGNPQVFRNQSALGNFSAGGLPFRGVSTRDDEGNVAFAWTMNGIRFAHLGLIDAPLSAETRAQLGPIDVLFLPVGNPLTLSDEVRAGILLALKPKITIPMSYANARTTRLAFGPLDPWLAAQTVPVKRLATSSITLTRTGLPNHPIVVVPAVP
ncbi:MAG: MBL fold metallo-hydrolase [Verrucomicrobia bacterium]|nr:MBL fold metallo-hydrolase [Verrucomicrobiota bacterium]